MNDIKPPVVEMTNQLGYKGALSVMSKVVELTFAPPQINKRIGIFYQVSLNRQRFSDYLDRLYFTTANFDPNKIFTDDFVDETPGVLVSLDKTIQERIDYHITHSRTVTLYWRTVVQFHSAPIDQFAAGFRLLAYPAPSANYCQPYTNCTWNDAIVMSKSIMIEVAPNKDKKEEWFIYTDNQQYIFLRFNTFDIGCQSGSDLTVMLSSTETLHLCNQNKPVFGLKSTGNLLTITFTFEKRANRLLEGFGAIYTKQYKLDMSEGLLSEVETADVAFGQLRVGKSIKACSKRMQKCYILIDILQDTTWTFVNTHVCRNHNWSLVSLHSELEQDFVGYLLISRLNKENYQNVHIGLRKGVNSRLEYQWSDGSPVTYTSWAQSHPSPGRGMCSMMRLRLYESHTWESIACNKPMSGMAVCLSQWKESTASGGSQEDDEETLRQSENNLTQLSRYLLDVFVCRNSEIISLLGRCNEVSDCVDGSDEENCTDVTDSCALHQFRCGDGTCVSISVLCDHRPDCADKQDEDCDFPECDEVAEFMCAEDRRCLPDSLRCDRKVDCFDQTDENNCGDDDCNNGNSFLCGDLHCISYEFVCDGISDCISGEDELECQLPNSCQAWWNAGYQESGLYHIQGGDVECDFTQMRTENKIITKFHNIDHERIVSEDINSVFTYSVEGGLYRPIQNETCYQSVDQLCQPWVQRLYEIDKAQEELSNTSASLHVCHCLRYRQLLLSSRTSLNLSDSVIEDCNGTKVFPESAFHLKFERDPTSGIINSMILKRNHVFDVNQLKLRVQPISCYTATDKTQEETRLACGYGYTTAKKTRCLYKQNVFGHIVGCRSLEHLQNCATFTCPGNYFKCPRSFCVEMQYVCDGIAHCKLGEDEQNCDTMTCESEYRCLQSSICLPRHYLCDGYPQCPLGDDERLCNYTCPSGCSFQGFITTCKANNESSLHETINISPVTRMLDISGNSEAFRRISFDAPFDYLIHLNVSSCGLRNVSASIFSIMKNLIVIDLSWNYLTTLPPQLFASQSRLKTLRLSNNLELLTIQTDAFAGLEIKYLSLNFLKIQRIFENAFASLHLDYLDFSHNDIEQIDDNAFATLSSKRIFLNETEIGIFSTDLFKGIEHVSWLVTDALKFCCIKPYFLTEEQCLPRENEISSCEDLLRNEVIRPFAWAVGLTAIVSNLLAFIYRMYDKERLKLGYGIFVSNLAVSDFLMGVYLIIITSADVHYRGNYMMNDDLWRQGWLCQFAGVLATVSSETSVLFICLVTVDRLLVVRFPFGEVRMRTRPSWVFAAVAWLIGLFVSTFPIMFKTYFRGEFYSRSSVCLALPLTGDRPAGWVYSVLIFIGVNFVMFALIAIGQWLIFREVALKQDKVMSKSKSSRKKELRVARNLLLVAMTDFLCWFPVGILGMLALSGVTISGDVYSWITVFVLPINSALNPFLYTLLGIVKKEAMLPEKDEHVQTFTFPKVVVDEFFNVWQTLDICNRPPGGYTSAVAVLGARKINLQECILIAKGILKPISQLHARKIVQKNLSLCDIYLRVSGGRWHVILNCHPQLGNKQKAQAENIKSFGDILSHLLDAYQSD